MNSVPAILGAVVTELPKHNRSFGKVPALLLSDILLIVGVGLGLLLVLAGGIYLWMRWRRNRRRHIAGGEKVYRDSRSRSEESDEDDSESLPAGDIQTEDREEDPDDEDGHSKRRYKYRVRRRTHRARNPTLSETGGLPPVKTQEPGKSC